MSNPKWLSRSLIELQMHYCLVLSNDEYLAAVREVEGGGGHAGYWLKDPASGATVNWAKDADGVTHAIVSLQVRERDTPVQIAGRLCHEAVHVFQEQCRVMGEDAPSDEFQAWSIQHIAESLMQAYAERMK